MMKRVTKALLWAVVVLTAPALWATTLLKQTDRDLIRQSGIVLTGRCTHLETAWVGRMLVTKATIAVGEVLKGDAGRELTVVLPGGVDANRKIPIAATYPGGAEILVREQVLLFLTPDSLVRDGYSVVGDSQGKFTLVETRESGPVATQNLSGLQLQNGTETVRGGSISISLRQLRETIREVAAERVP